MKFTKKAIATFSIIALIFTSCSKDETVETDVTQKETSELKLSAEIDTASDAIDDVMIEVYENQEGDETGKMPNVNRPNFLPDCVTITAVIEQGFREITVDFGAEGCLINGNNLKGKVIMSYDREASDREVLITYTLEDFYINAKHILGSKTILKQLENENGNPQFAHTLDLTVIWPSGAQASRQGLKVREWVEGFGSGVFSDNVFKITGNWTSTFVNGNSHSYEVVIPLRRQMSCYYVVSGSIAVSRNNFSGVFDYGTGDCDNSATFTFNSGDVIDIVLN
ncbi:hypothetical protein N7U66_15720 [Lacinutrix neustonica]|uniref:Lipoprotein n=1 Tax=Lacinutrix neustonica TaxID=2980107 RepID=A0A9E8MWB0_9FLAO|nr:hypothetical protein [Lacinutrix neustonica]WAC01454.1 hypothetical protein N7U66_15720 [Lacinutrix neustonica]